MAADRRLVAGACAFLLAAACCGTPCTAREDIIATSRVLAATDGSKATVEQSYFLDTPDGGPPGAVLLVLPGGNGNISLRREADRIVFGQGDLLFIKNRGGLRAAGTAVAMPDLASNQREGLTVAARKEPRHAADLLALVADLRGRFPGATVWVAGVGSAGYSMFNLAARSPDGVTGVIAIGAPTVHLRMFDFGPVRSRVLLLQHVEDLCESSSLIEAAEIAARQRFDLVAVSGGAPSKQPNPCNVGAKFALNGNDAEVMQIVQRWMRGDAVAPVTQPVRTSLNERVIRIPTALGGAELETTLYQPDGGGPFPLVVFTHGIPEDKFVMEQEKRRIRYVAAANAFVQRGFMVAMVMRRGYGMSGGRYNPSNVGNIFAFGNYDADDLRAALDHLAQLPQVDRERIVIGGQSGGGLATLAFGSQPSREVRGLLNFAGGLRSTRDDWRGLMVQAFGRFGAQTRVPSLWFYAANDSFFDPEQAQRAFEAYRSAGGERAQLVKVEAFKRDGHGLFADPDGVTLWWPPTEKFLLDIGMLK